MAIDQIVEVSTNEPIVAKARVDKPRVKPVESKYQVAELAGLSKRLGVSAECVIVAFKLAGKTEATYAEAGEIIKNFMNRKVM